MLLSRPASSSSAEDLLDPSQDQIAYWALMPSPERPQAEVRLVHRGRATVVQTIVDSKVPKKVLGRIADREATNWPPGRDGHADSVRYLEALTSALLEDPPESEDGPGGRKDRRSRLSIDFILTDGAALVALGRPRLDREERPFEVVSADTLTVLELSRPYVAENMRWILEDAFGPGTAALQALAERR